MPDAGYGGAASHRLSASPSPFRLRHAACLLRRGGLLVYPTEGVFGIGCDPDNEGALRRVIAAKGRAWDKGLILIAATEDQALRHAGALSPGTLERLRASWPGPVTWVVPARRGLSPMVTGGRDTVALRVTAHPVAAALCRAFGGALVSTSANRSARPPARTALAARKALGDCVDAVLPGRVGGAAGPSRVVAARDGRLLRG